MNEAFVTFQGWVGNEVVHRETAQGNVANFRVGSTPRIRKRNGEWVDGPTSWFSVTCWRTLADNVATRCARATRCWCTAGCAPTCGSARTARAR